MAKLAALQAASSDTSTYITPDDSGFVCDRARLLQQPALMFAFKGQRAVFYSAAADCADRWCAQQETRPEDAG
jgi:hypothetical protein